jgi:hypothetical protein
MTLQEITEKRMAKIVAPNVPIQPASSSSHSLKQFPLLYLLFSIFTREPCQLQPQDLQRKLAAAGEA